MRPSDAYLIRDRSAFRSWRLLAVLALGGSRGWEAMSGWLADVSPELPRVCGAPVSRQAQGRWEFPMPGRGGSGRDSLARAGQPSEARFSSGA